MEMNLNNPFKSQWEMVEEHCDWPTRLRDIIEVDFSDFAEQICLGEEDFAAAFVESLFSGDIIILKNTLPKDFLLSARELLHQHGQKTKSEYFQMLEGCPDFHRLINGDIAKNYSFKAIKHSYYFFPWNEDRFRLLDETYKRWSIIKVASGLRSDEYRTNTPKDGIVDRLQVVHYPAGAGQIETHSDPYKIQRVIISGIMSKRGEDYDTGGAYFVNGEDEKTDIEDRLDCGDWVIYAPTVLHGVKTVDEALVPNWKNSKGRWWFGPFSNASNEIKDRHTGYSVQEVANERIQSAFRLP